MFVCRNCGNEFEDAFEEYDDEPRRPRKSALIPDRKSVV